MRKAWKLYEGKTIKSAESKAKKGVFLIPQEEFKLLEFSILPSIDEEDRQRTVLKKLEERFVEGKELPFLYFEVLQESLQEEKILCCYLPENWKQVELPKHIECAIPSFLVGRYLFEKKNGVLVEYGKKEILISVYQNGKIDFFQKKDRFDPQECSPSFEMTGDVLLLGDYSEEEFLGWQESFHLLDLEKLSISKVRKEIDIFQHTRLQKWRNHSYQSFVSKGLLFFLLINIALGFYYQYNLEQVKEILAHLEEENKYLEVDSRKLEEEIINLRQEQEEMEEGESMNFKKITAQLETIYSLASRLEIVSLEYLESESFKLQFYSFSTKEYLKFLNKLILAEFQFINHDSIQKQEEQYKFEIEITKKEEL